MNTLQHTAFYFADNTDTDWLVTQIIGGSGFAGTLPCNGLQGEIFSNTTLQHFIDEEIRHDHYEIVAGKNNTLSSSSSGEQRKALLFYLLSKKPGYIIIDNVFQSLDIDARQVVFATLQELSSTVMLIQLFNRKRDLLPFINTVYSMHGSSVIVCEDRETFSANANFASNAVFNAAIPPPLHKYQSQNGPLVKMNNVSVQYNGKPVLQNICWQINEREFWQLTGPNGSGKSTLLSLITGNNPKGFGQDLVLFGRRKGSGETVWELKEKIGYFAPAMTMHFERQDSIEQMIISGFFDSVGLYIKPSDRQVQLAGEWLSLIGFYKDRKQPFRMFPTGYQRMILIARAMVKHPPLLILDEPTAGLDDDMTSLFTSLINRISAGSNTTILYVSHRDEAGLTPSKIFELTPNHKGSTGNIVT